MASFAYVKLVQHGSIASSQSWSVGLSVAITNPTAPTEGDLSAWLATLDTVSQSWWVAGAGVADLNAPDTTYDGNRAYYYAAGSTVAVAAADRSFATPKVGSQSGGLLPARTCLVSSLRTGMAGKSFRGRRYLPATAAGLTDHQVGSTLVGHIATVEATLLTAINASSIASGDCLAVIANNRTSPPAVTEVIVNSNPDTQRRRTDKIGAIFTSVAIL